jgi:hypothetical protein
MGKFESLLPAENAENQVHDEERTDDNETHEIDPRPTDPHRVVDLKSIGIPMIIRIVNKTE